MTIFGDPNAIDESKKEFAEPCNYIKSYMTYIIPCVVVAPTQVLHASL